MDWLQKFFGKASEPFEIHDKDVNYVLVTIDSSDHRRDSLAEVVKNYCDTEVSLQHYKANDLWTTVMKFAKENNIKNPHRIKDGQKVKIHHTILKKELQRKAKKAAANSTKNI